MTPIGIVSPLVEEARVLLSSRSHQGPFVQLQDGTLLWISGVGRRRAGQAAQALLQHGAGALVSWGTAGGLDPSLRSGDLLLPDSILGVEGNRYPTDADWRGRLQQRLATSRSVRSEPITEAARVYSEPIDKSVCFENTAAVAVDMESAAVAEVAAEAQVPFLTLRAVCDTADMNIPPCALSAVDEHGKVCAVPLLQSLVQRPQDLGHLLRLQRSFMAARSCLQDVVHQVGPRLLG